MKSSHAAILVIILVLVAGGVYAFMRNSAPAAPATPATATVSVTSQTTGTAPAATVSGSATVSATPVAPAPVHAVSPAAKHFTVNGNDATADVKTITVAKGTPVSITFGADAGTTYHGGLDFRSASVSTGTIAPGSTKTISFTANSNMTFTPYWPSTNIAKPYVINVVVTS